MAIIEAWKRWKRLLIHRLASQDIHDLKVVVDARNEFILSQEKQFKAFIERSSKDEIELRKQIDYQRNLLSTSSHAFDAREKEYKQEINILELENNSLRLQKELLQTQLDITVAFLNEERETLKATQEMIYLRTGMKREVFPASSDTDKEEKEIKPQRSGRMTRSQIKNELELRAERLLKEQRDKEAEAITKGDLAPKEGVH